MSALSTLEFPLRARHAGTDPVHAARSIRAGGHNTACLMWLDPKATHERLPEDSEITCSRCADRVTEK
ncbi:hypothetical protein OH540_09295 [Streptomyces sp. BPPL-273]|uniref:hypothetical protein n=1 Tax=Streptomyces sp. BPPL-273 TaxID=2987533 RepID=UPI0024AF2983|nr:hypothetical protein [Streptomyces sp. BPPL-273]WHM30216.1 hypothetical protein OH540_09295 [Streptomyces sp. BPPL-273]